MTEFKIFLCMILAYFAFIGAIMAYCSWRFNQLEKDEENAEDNTADIFSTRENEK